MRIAIIASPFLCIPPRRYGGTELFIGNLAEGLKAQGVDVVVYACGESTLSTEVRSIYPKEDWPLEGEIYANLKDLNHTAWALRDCWDTADIVHLNNASGVAFSRFANPDQTTPAAERIPKKLNPPIRKRVAPSQGPGFVCTIHHPNSKSLSSFYGHYPNVHYVTISRFQQSLESMPRIRTIHHGVDLDCYTLRTRKQQYLSFIGRIAPVKGTHLAIEVALRAGIPLKIAGEVQPLFKDYFETKVKPHIDGRNIEYVGEADLAAKNELLGNSMATLFPIQWDEPFGLVMIEAMATGTPVIALPGGSVKEIVKDGISGWVCQSVNDMAQRVRDAGSISPVALRSYVRQNFSVERMTRDYLGLYREMLGLPAIPEAAGIELQDVNDTEEPPARAVA